MTVQEHLQQARQNERLAGLLGSSPIEAYDWAVTVLFYALLHFVDAHLLDQHGIIPRGHTATWDRRTGQRSPGRNDQVKQHLFQIYEEYKVLYSASRQARYEGAFLASSSIGYYQKLRENQFATAREFFRQLGW